MPFRHSNGLAIYHHSSASAGGGAPEYMVSAVARGSPTDVLSVLMHPQSATTILGPALEVEVLDNAPGRQVRGAHAWRVCDAAWCAGPAMRVTSAWRRV
jgi:hypothetical protein